MTDALNPALPVGGNQVQVASELRGIKARLVLDKANIEALQVLTTPLTLMTSLGQELLTTPSTDDAQNNLGATTLGKGLFTSADANAAKALLGITSGLESVVTSFGGKKGTITWAGGTKLKWTEESVPSGGGGYDMTFDTAFPNAIFGVMAGYSGNSSGTAASNWVNGAPTLSGVNVDHGAGSAKFMIVWALGY